MTEEPIPPAQPRGSDPTTAAGRYRLTRAQANRARSLKAATTTKNRALARGFRPTRLMRLMLATVASDPSLGPKEAARLLEIDDDTLRLWSAKPDWRAWWNAELIEAARVWTGPALQELRTILTDRTLHANARVRAAEVFLREIGGVTSEREAAVMAILDAFRGAGPGAEVRIGVTAMPDGRGVLAGEVSKPREPAETERLGADLGVMRATPSRDVAMLRVARMMRAEAIHVQEQETGVRALRASTLNAIVPGLLEPDAMVSSGDESPLGLDGPLPPALPDAPVLPLASALAPPGTGGPSLPASAPNVKSNPEITCGEAAGDIFADALGAD